MYEMATKNVATTIALDPMPPFLSVVGLRTSKKVGCQVQVHISLNKMAESVFTITAIAFFVLLAYSVNQLADTY